MPPLSNARHERFVGLLLEGRSASAAYAEAGYQPDDGNAAKLKAHPRVQQRLAELQTEVAKDTKVTVASLLAEFEEARIKATSLDQMSAAVRSISEKARLSGLMVEKKQVEIGGPGDFSNCSNAESIVDELVKFSLNPYHDFRDEDRQTLLEMFRGLTQKIHAFVEAVKARPVISVSLDKPKRLTHGNGKAPQ
jgi:phage terminase small subunit